MSIFSMIGNDNPWDRALVALPTQPSPIVCSELPSWPVERRLISGAISSSARLPGVLADIIADYTDLSFGAAMDVINGYWWDIYEEYRHMSRYNNPTSRWRTRLFVDKLLRVAGLPLVRLTPAKVRMVTHLSIQLFKVSNGWFKSNTHSYVYRILLEVCAMGP